MGIFDYILGDMEFLQGHEELDQEQRRSLWDGMDFDVYLVRSGVLHATVPSLACWRYPSRGALRYLLLFFIFICV